MAISDDLTLASDATLVVGIGRYRQDALAEAYRRHAGAVSALARRLLNEQSLAEEVVQEVFFRLWDTPEKFDAARGSLRSYLALGVRWSRPSRHGARRGRDARSPTPGRSRHGSVPPQLWGHLRRRAR